MKNAGTARKKLTRILTRKRANFKHKEECETARVLITKGLSWLEHLTVNQRVAGSSPASGASKKIKGLYFDSMTLFHFTLNTCHLLHHP